MSINLKKRHTYGTLFSHLQKKGKSLFGVALILLLLCACSLGSNPPHQTYSYHGPEEWAADHTSGERILVTWTTQPGPISYDLLPARVLLSVKLIGGPFRTVDDFLAAIRKSHAARDTFPPGAILLAAPPILTDNWTSRPYTSTLTLPQHLKPGYYDLFYTVTTTYPRKPSVVSREDALFRINVPHTSN